MKKTTHSLLRDDSPSRTLLHYLSHRSLVRRVPRSRAVGSVDAVVVPSVHTGARLRPAVDLAAGLEAPLVVLHSDAGRASEIRSRLEQGGHNARVAVFPPNFHHPALNFGTSTHVEGRCEAYPDLGTKRSVGLLLARLAGWRRLLFLDDDIRGLSVAEVKRAAGWLGRPYRAVGWKVLDCPDNSVVCHALRIAGEPQDTFVTASALLVDTTSSLPYYPSIYDEDWLALWDGIASRRVALAGVARQLPYDPFDDPARARAQEFGDLLAEGLMWLLHQGHAGRAMEPSFWADRLRARRALIDLTATRIDARSSRDDSARAMLSLGAAASSSAKIDPRACASFVAEWRRDLRRWYTATAAMPRLRCLSAAIGALGLEA